MTRLVETTLNTAAPMAARPRAPGHGGHAWLLGGFVWGVGVWLYEGVLTTVQQPEGAVKLAQAGRATLFFYEFLGITTALVLGLLWAGVPDARTGSSSVAALRARWTELGLARVGARRRAIARLYARFVVVVGCLWFLFYATREVVLRIGNRDNLGLATVGMQVAVLVLGLAAVRGAERGISRALGWRGFTRAEGFFRLGPHVAVVLVLCLALVAGVVVGFWQAFAELLRRYAVPGALGVLVAAGTAKLVPHLHGWPRARRATSFCIVALAALSGVSGAYVSEHTYDAWSNAPFARVAVGWGHFWLDWDRDAHLSGFGERDCSPFDASIHPGALDRPGNRSDEDCDGVDARSQPSGVSSTAGSARPNLYLITIDALATSTLETYGGAPGIAPSLGQFAKRSVVFENFFVQGPSTRLSFPALFTSRYDTHIHRVLKGRFPFELAPSNHMLAEVLADAGYDTLAVIPSPYFSERHWRGLLQGFRSVATEPAEAYAAGVAHTASSVTASALEFLQLPRHRPRFLWVHYFDAHPPHRLPKELEARGSRDADLYAAEVTHLDRHVARLIDQIIEHDPNHVIILTSDHGMAFDEPRHQQDHYGYDLSTLVLHVPLLVRAPGLAPRRVPNLVDALDLAPTLTRLAGITPPESFMGHSLLPLLTGKTIDLPGVRFAQLYLGEEALRGREPLVMVAARTAEHNLVFDRRAGRLAAWRWQKDPEERRDRWPAVQSSAPPDEVEIAKLRALKGALDAHLYEVVAPSSHSHRSHNETDPK